MPYYKIHRMQGHYGLQYFHVMPTAVKYKVAPDFKTEVMSVKEFISKYLVLTEPITKDQYLNHD